MHSARVSRSKSAKKPVNTKKDTRKDTKKDVTKKKGTKRDTKKDVTKKEATKKGTKTQAFDLFEEGGEAELAYSGGSEDDDMEEIAAKTFNNNTMRTTKRVIKKKKKKAKFTTRKGFFGQTAKSSVPKREGSGKFIFNIFQITLMKKREWKWLMKAWKRMQ